mmetsp:Transcript_4483/g.6763  ORF Transcript_4483/g.6763 Transcript_4483/m.6763 type:complete len:172 (-) Transcript_4483:516-1031(-)
MTVEDAVLTLHYAIENFEKTYEKTIKALLSSLNHQNLLLCTLYNPNFEKFNLKPDQKAIRVGVTLMCDVIIRTAQKFGLPVLDMRKVMGAENCCQEGKKEEKRCVGREEGCVMVSGCCKVHEERCSVHVQEECFANHIEANCEGGIRIASNILSVLISHPFEKGVSIVYPQ